MTNEKKGNWYRDEDGDITTGGELVICFPVLLMIVLILVGITMGICAIHANYEVQAFNRIHSTDYTFGEWFWASQTIKDYHIGTVENKNLNVDLNINRVSEQ